MRDLLFKNLTSSDKKRRVIASSEIVDSKGVRSVIQRHFICILKELNEEVEKEATPYIYVLKRRDNRLKSERFFCKIKGSLHMVNKGSHYLITYMHCLKIDLAEIK
ncbi:MAG: hypothetical protein ABIH18_04610 [Candidatus Omnitrophota bacterium]